MPGNWDRIAFLSRRALRAWAAARIRVSIIGSMVDSADRAPDSSVDLLVKAHASDLEALNRLLARDLPQLERFAGERHRARHRST